MRPFWHMRKTRVFGPRVGLLLIKIPSGVYGLQKLHKQGVPLRPIVAITKSPASNIRKWLCTALKPLLHSQKSIYIKIILFKNLSWSCTQIETVDSSEKSILSSFDIVSMYTGIDVSKSEQLLQNKPENNYHLIEESRALG